ncbi:unnamed protein product [Amoebophrya sp. A25]|nr:unnamed protein product [Amoebophrya sp. A25]|eukprot:GSA25T00000255001.1
MADARSIYKLPVTFAKRPGTPLPKPGEEPREVLLALREQATAEGVSWSLDDNVSDIRMSIQHYRDIKAGTHKRLPKFFDALTSGATETERPKTPPIELADEEKAKALKKKMADPAARLKSSAINMGLPFSMTGVTTTKTQDNKTEASRRNVRLMEKLAMIDESAQRLQAMLREETASVPGQQIPDTAHKEARERQKAVWQANIVDIATRDFQPKRPRSRSALSGFSNRSGVRARAGLTGPNGGPSLTSLKV